MMLSNKETFAVYMRVGGIFLFGLILLPLLLIAYPLAETLDTLVNAVAEIAETQPLLSIFLFLGLTIVAALVSLVGIYPLVPTAVLLWGGVSTFFLLMIGWLIGDMILYFLGRAAGGSNIRNSKQFQKIEKFLTSIPQTEFLIIVLLRLALPTEMFGYALGVLKYPFVRYTIITIIAELPFALLTVYGAEAFLAGNFVALSGIILFGAAIIGLSFVFTRRRNI